MYDQRKTREAVKSHWLLFDLGGKEEGVSIEKSKHPVFVMEIILINLYKRMRNLIKYRSYSNLKLSPMLTVNCPFAIMVNIRIVGFIIVRDVFFYKRSIRLEGSNRDHKNSLLEKRISHSLSEIKVHVNIFSLLYI